MSRIRLESSPKNKDLPKVVSSLSRTPGARPSLEMLKAYGAGYLVMDVDILSPMDIAGSRVTTRINSFSGHRLVLTEDVLVSLRQRLPADAFCILAITMKVGSGNRDRGDRGKINCEAFADKRLCRLAANITNTNGEVSLRIFSGRICQGVFDQISS